MMKYRFADTGNYLYESGAFFLGVDDQGREIGVKSERHAITIAGARAGKGACQIIPNLLRWPENSLTIDPSGENVAATWQALEAAGKKVVLLDPFHHAERHYQVPARLRGSVNVLDGMKPDGLTVREDIRVIADGLVKRYKVEDGTWDNGAVSVLAGYIAYVLADPDPASRTLATVRHLLTMPEGTRDEILLDMSNQEGFGKLARAAATIGLSKTKKAGEYFGSAVDHADWLDSAPFVELLGSSSFSLSELKTGNVAVFLVLPHEYINEHSRFLRLFVRCALDAMTKGGKGKRRCLFLLDEFYSLGTIDEIAKAAGALPKFGAHLWPFLQDLGQLQALYGAQLSETFFGNSDAACFFGNSDQLTLKYVSAALGKVTVGDITAPPPQTAFDASALFAPSQSELAVARDHHHAEERAAMNAYQHERAKVGTPRMTPEDLAAYIGRGHLDQVARRMIVFAKQGDVLSPRPAPYFDTPRHEPQKIPKPAPPPQTAPIPRQRIRIMARIAVRFGLSATQAVLLEHAAKTFGIAFVPAFFLGMFGFFDTITAPIQAAKSAATFGVWMILIFTTLKYVRIRSI